MRLAAVSSTKLAGKHPLVVLLVTEGRDPGLPDFKLAKRAGALIRAKSWSADAGESLTLHAESADGPRTLVLLGLIGAWVFHPGFALLAAFVAVGQIFAGVTDWCGMGLLLAKAPWNRTESGKGPGAPPSACAAAAPAACAAPAPETSAPAACAATANSKTCVGSGSTAAPAST